jgi:hypothetical protein
VVFHPIDPEGKDDACSLEVGEVPVVPDCQTTTPECGSGIPLSSRSSAGLDPTCAPENIQIERKGMLNKGPT